MQAQGHTLVVNPASTRGQGGSRANAFAGDATKVFVGGLQEGITEDVSGVQCAAGPSHGRGQEKCST